MFPCVWKGSQTVVYAEEKFPIQLMNVTSEPQHIYKNTVVGNISPVESLIEAQPTEGAPTSFKHEGAESESMLPIHLKQLYASSVKYVSDDQANKLRRVLIKYENLFAKSDKDMGRTNVVKHKIETKEARPVKLVR
jgi:hypothetical protein